VLDDDGLDDLVDVGLAGDLVQAVWRGHERGAEAYGQVVRVHHVLVTVLGQAGGGGKETKLSPRENISERITTDRSDRSELRVTFHQVAGVKDGMDLLVCKLTG